MSHDPRHIRTANLKIEKAREEHRRKQAAYADQCRERLPGLRQLDRDIRRTVAQAIAAALQQGTDPGPAVERARRENLELQARREELLRGAGIDPQDLEETPLCPLCRDTGWHKGKLCTCVETLCVEANREELGRTLDLEWAEFSRFSLEPYSTAPDPEEGVSPREAAQIALEVCRDYAERFPEYRFDNLFLHGGTGLGKTLLSGCIAQRVVRRGFWVVYATAGELFSQYETVKFSYDAPQEAREAVRRYENCDLLVLDDLGSEMTTQFVQSALYQLLNQRMNQRRHTVISSNLDENEVRARYTPQVASRLVGTYQSLPFLGEDIRCQRD